MDAAYIGHFFDRIPGIISQARRHCYKMGLEGLRDSYFTSLFAAPYLGLLTNFACVFVVGFSLEDFNMVTELSRYNLGVAFFLSL